MFLISYILVVVWTLLPISMAVLINSFFLISEKVGMRLERSCVLFIKGFISDLRCKFNRTGLRDPKFTYFAIVTNAMDWCKKKYLS